MCFLLFALWPFRVSLPRGGTLWVRIVCLFVLTALQPVEQGSGLDKALVRMQFTDYRRFQVQNNIELRAV